MDSIILSIALVAVIITLIAYINANNKYKKTIDEQKIQIENQTKLLERYSPIIAIEDEIVKLQSNFNKTQEEWEELKLKYDNSLKIYKKLLQDIEISEDKIEYINIGVYEPSFDFNTSEEFKEKLIENKEKQKNLIKSNHAVFCTTQWEVNNSKSQGTTLMNKAINLTLRAFNGECDSTVSKVKWNNIQVMEERIKKAFDAINKLNLSNNIVISAEYLKLKLEELRLTHEYAQKLHQEKEEQREIKAQIREEEQAQREFEQAQKEAEKEEADYQKALEKARKEMLNAKDEQLIGLEDKIKVLEQQIKEAEEKKQRALSQAQLTRSGYVYVISNIGSFGEDVYKIGMTRRLEPMDRVRELGDASVPFTFDVHAMIYSKDAPTLEKKLHKVFDNKRLNMVNNKKEFFNVSLNEIEKEVLKENAKIQFTKIAEAQDYRESKLIKNKDKNNLTIDKLVEEKYPISL